jgi:FixJ family two-component response regulator
LRDLALELVMGRALRIAPPIVIVVEDDPDVLGSLKFAFEVEGFHVCAHASAEALLDDEGALDSGCLVLDYKLPGMDGLALLARLREGGHDLPALLITTPNAEIAGRAALAGVAIVEKPLLCDTLVGKVRDLLNPRRRSAEPRASAPR